MNKVKSFIILGKLTKPFHSKNGVKFIPNKNFSVFLEKLNEIFFLFSNKIRYIKKIKIYRSVNNGHFISLNDCEILHQIKGVKSVKVAVLKTDYYKLKRGSGSLNPTNLPIYDESSNKVGVVSEFIKGYKQSLLLVKMKNGKEILIPYVDKYIVSLTLTRVYVKDIKELENL